MYRDRLEELLPELRGRIGEAAGRVGRRPEAVRIVAVTKAHSLEAVTSALEKGLRDLGENRIEELEAKATALGSADVRWHMVGHVQRRQAGRLHGLADLVHSVDSIRLAERLVRTAPRGPDREPLGVLLQVNVSGEQTKGGFEPARLCGAIERVLSLGVLRVDGLMTMAPFTKDEKVLRRTFRGLRELNEEARERVLEYEGVELSMGMSNDYELAVEEGSTMVRIGTALFGERQR